MKIVPIVLADWAKLKVEQTWTKEGYVVKYSVPLSKPGAIIVDKP